MNLNILLLLHDFPGDEIPDNHTNEFTGINVEIEVLKKQIKNYYDIMQTELRLIHKRIDLLSERVLDKQ